MARIAKDPDDVLEPKASLPPERRPGDDPHRSHRPHPVHVHRFASHVLRVKPGVERSTMEQSLARALGIGLAEFREAVRAREAGRTPRWDRGDDGEPEASAGE